ncbi:SLATT domain-containing protein [Photobacterium toruni]|uniref:SMODS and SLOG-associating 2TM effector domain-containing protein n=1 Tax=Photobacterium toruni TaxID=1935446 RepID=A0A1T4PWA8_9GAMM|nr:SLATT domain-containing protein [Photobacterium toruni]SJZ95511.1 hypothetical protein CZ814_00886 [Photobacterium toruni]
MDKDSIWWTRKSWINAESRLLRYADWSNKYLFWYSLCGVFASVLLLGETQPDVISKVFICFSVFVFCMSLFISLGRHNERANKFKCGYIELQSLYIKVKDQNCLSIEDSKKYSKILESCENHSWIDFLNAKVNVYNNTNNKDDLTIKARWYDFVLYYSIKVINVILIIAILSIPVLIIYFSYK